MIVTIDGVAASGKSSVASGVARALGVPYVSSGLLYRAATLLGQDAGLDLTDQASLLAYLRDHPLRLEPLAEGNRVWQGQRDLTPELHSSAVDQGVSQVAAHPEVRAWVDDQLRALTPPFVAEGRDMGTNVFPHAPAKFYLTASPRVRAERRSRERPEAVEAIEAALIQRDALDTTQSAPAPDARVIDTGPLTLEQVIVAITSQLPSQ
ncbi:(d)CMP kinase [Deinococcus deserti]|uniref:Cytidylate kinase n=1 Tax=Deinococcus deserti (strain DSM 17065 / CIP 109153 / LMG 22923 / VCD115) TaxID=546414 RepID=KCY_DEIDV|nr:(d)CMP kinase [Deinococcus deserti]C1CZK3.1 RecName: Full=Cytidylate kinase; Short=CK; AltName: Full=Cytidine monophosphate kinase; Short=CMP kinase [Deinococcus deserti VCD115]ACO47251.1 putative cytidylate kinase (Cytidine monophosphate kinase) (Deoxycytidine kinase) (Deoxycytidylate kinase) [Deinococcus deserti VCD115]